MQLFPECSLPEQQPPTVMLKPRKRVSSDGRLNETQKIRMHGPPVSSPLAQHHPLSSAPLSTFVYPSRPGVKRVIPDRSLARNARRFPTLSPSMNNLSSAIDVVEFHNEYRIYIDLPSVLPDSIHIDVQKGGIRIECVRIIRYDGCTRVLMKHRPSGKFFVFFPCDHSLLDIPHSKATFHNGELLICIQRKDGATAPSHSDPTCTMRPSCPVSDQKAPTALYPCLLVLNPLVSTNTTRY